MDIKIVRKILSRLLNADARSISLMSEPISPDFIPQIIFSHGASQHYDFVSGYSFKNGLKPFDDIKRQYTYSNDGKENNTDGEALHEYFKRKDMDSESFDFIIVQFKGMEYHGYEYDGVSIYKIPDFKSYWEKLER